MGFYFVTMGWVAEIFCEISIKSKYCIMLNISENKTGKYLMGQKSKFFGNSVNDFDEENLLSRRSIIADHMTNNI